jgi:hypothetical protein
VSPSPPSQRQMGRVFLQFVRWRRGVISFCEALSVVWARVERLPAGASGVNV